MAGLWNNVIQYAVSRPSRARELKLIRQLSLICRAKCCGLRTSSDERILPAQLLQGILLMFDQIKRFFFEKCEHAFGTAEATGRNQRRHNALFALDPDVMVRHLSAYRQGDICGLERVLDEFEQRDDKMRIGAFKMAAAVAAKPCHVQIAQGEEENARAKLHQ